MNFMQLRREFPVTERFCYVDHAGVSPISRATAEAGRRFLDDVQQHGDVHSEAWEQRADAVRRSFAQWIGGREDGVAFVKNTTQGLLIVASGMPWRCGDNVVISNVEFPANVYPWLNLARRGVETRMVPMRDGRIHIDDVRAAMDGRTRVLSLSHVEFANGFRNDLAALGDLCRSRGVFFCMDAIQSLGVMPLDLRDTPVDFLSADGHKWLLAPEGCGFIYCGPRALELLETPNAGWKSVVNYSVYDNYDFTLLPNAQRFEEGSLNMLGVHVLGAALDLLMGLGIEAIWQRVLGLLDVAAEGVRAKGYELLTPMEESVRSGILLFQHARQQTDALVDRLTQANVICAKRGGGVRISPHCYNNEDDMAQIIAALPD